MANETAKEKIPEELSLALVLTIYEAKGLEFDDVLLYNFFTDSEVFNSYPFSAFFSEVYLSCGLINGSAGKVFPLFSEDEWFHQSRKQRRHRFIENVFP